MPTAPAPRRPSLRRRAARIAVQLGAVIVCATFVPRLVCGCRASALYAGELDAEDSPARAVAATARSGVTEKAFHTGSRRFDAEWVFGTYTMTALGLGQVILTHPQRRDDYLPVVEICAGELLTEETAAFGTEAWGHSAFSASPGKGHGYMGYTNLALGMLRLLEPSTAFARRHDALTEYLAKQLEAAPHALFETYPGEAYPADMAMVAGSIALHDCATGAPARPWLTGWRRDFEQWIEPRSGLAYQSGVAATGQPAGPPRSSGTALAAYALSFLDRDFSARLFDGLRRSATSLLGFGAVREYAPGHEGEGDIDSGPVLLGVGVSATGFTLSSARLHRDEELFTSLYRTADLFGVPVQRDHARRFVSGGPLGNAILLAMVSATWSWTAHCQPKVSP